METATIPKSHFLPFQIANQIISYQTTQRGQQNSQLVGGNQQTFNNSPRSEKQMNY